MWLLSTDRAELYSFGSPENVPGGYAILSHVWDKEEQSYQDVRRIQESCAKHGTNPREFVCEKIRRCCELAERHGFAWVWIDTCCIDKTSSAELSEAINSMFRYYALSRICYGYLRDVPNSSCYIDAPEAFVRSVWFMRGWTLQELIAPRFFLFLSQSWSILGSKADFAEVIEAWIYIPATLLRFHNAHTEFSIAQRMSWFGRRETTRLEDEAYCLLGLFDIHMSPLYGEGMNAFRRLQEEIMKQSTDTTLFGWPGSGSSFWHLEEESCLLAPSPSAFSIFQSHRRYLYVPQRIYWLDRVTDNNSALEPRGRGLSDITFSVTPHGILAHIPIIVADSGTYADLYWYADRAWHLDGPVLLRLKADPDGQGHSTRRPLYCVDAELGLRIKTLDWSRSPAGEYVIDGQTGLRALWQEVLIRHRPRPHAFRQDGALSGSRPYYIPPIPVQLAFDAPFRFEEPQIRKFMRQSLGWCGRLEIYNADFHYPQIVDSPDCPPTAYVFRGRSAVAYVIKVGQCRQERLSGLQPQSAPVWATVQTYDLPGDFALSEQALHDCVKDHVSLWPDLGRKTFVVGPNGNSVTLCFSPCPVNPRRTLVLNATYLHQSHGGLIQLPPQGTSFQLEDTS